MRLIVTTASPAPSAEAVALAMAAERLHPGVEIVFAITNPLLALPSGTTIRWAGGRSAAARPMSSLTFDGIRYGDAWIAAGEAFAVWACLPALVESLGTDTPVVVLPDTTMLRGPLDGVARSLAPGAVGLVPFDVDATTGIATGGWIPGVAFVGPDPGATLDWWKRFARRSFLDPGGTRILHSPWEAMAVSPAIVPLTDPGLRVCARTLGDLALDGTGDAATADGAPLRLVHLDRFDPDEPWWIGGEDVPARLVSESDTLRDLCAARAEELRGVRSAGFPSCRELDLPDSPVGLPLSRSLRDLIRTDMAASIRRGETPRSPLDPSTADAFWDWIRDPAESVETGISPVADAVWRENPLLAATFPGVRWRNRSAFARWLWTSGVREGFVATAALPKVGATVARPVVRRPFAERPFGVNLVGYHDASLGLGVAVRLLARALDAAAIPWHKVSYDFSESVMEHRSDRDATAPYRYNAILISPEQYGFLRRDLGEEVFADRYNIGPWYWECDVLSEASRAALDGIDEIWGATRFIVDTFAAATDKPVELMPVPLEFPGARRSPERRAALGLDERFTFLFSFDLFTPPHRKNATGVIDAFRRAFDPEDGCRLIIKTMNGDRRVRELEALRAYAFDRPDIDVVDAYLSSDDRLDLIANVDAYVSLHRSEGLGLTMAEAMSVGTPVIATGYSGNLDFMSSDSALLVDAEIIPIGPGKFYPPDGHWADPSLDQAARHMQRLRNDADLRARLAAAGPAALASFNARDVGARVAARLQELDRLLLSPVHSHRADANRRATAAPLSS